MPEITEHSRPGVNMTATEQRAAFGLAGIFAMRMLGLFMVLPVFTLYAHELVGYTPALAGLAIGIYGLTQALLQIPFGMLSDRIGRKPVIATGLLLFAAGSVLAALADSMTAMIVGRALQGSGAVAAATMALAADLTREEHRTKAMAVIGMSIGMAFTVSLIAGPLVGHWLGLSGIFWVTGLLALIGIGILFLVVPNPGVTRFHRDAEAEPARLLSVLRDTQLLRLDAGILFLHLIMTATFVALPLALRDDAGLSNEHHWLVYLGVLITSVALMVPFIILAEKHRRMKPVFVGAVAAVGLAQFGLVFSTHSLILSILVLILYFAAFNILEASLPSLVSKYAHPASKGTAMGAYSTSQFLGAFLGGVTGGWLLGHLGVQGVFALSAAVTLAWLVLAVTMQAPRFLSPRLLHVGKLNPDQADELAASIRAVPGVAEVEMAMDEGTAYLKVDSAGLDETALEAFSQPPETAVDSNAGPGDSTTSDEGEPLGST